MSSRAHTKSQGEEATDLGSLWTQAVLDYAKQTGKDLKKDMRAQTIDDVMASTQKSMESFQGFRHKGDKVDKVRSAFGRHLNGMAKVMKGIQMVGNAAGAFPPAMPVGIVFAACGHLLAAFAGVKADYDRVEAFFNHSGRFFERLSIIENKGVDSGALGKAIVRVFSAQLSICAIVEVMTEKGGRLKQWMNALWNLEDQDLATAYGIMQASIDELAQTVGYASYAEIKSTQAITVTISDKADEIDSNIKKFRSELGRDVRLVYQEQLQTRLEMREGFRETQDVTREEAEKTRKMLAEHNAQLMKLVQASKSRPELGDKDKRKQTTKGTGKGDPGDKKFKALRSIKAHFDSHDELFPMWRDAHQENNAQHQEMRESYVDHTAEWLSSDPSFEGWTEGKNPLLWMKGPDGIGKSFLAHASLQKLREQDDGHTAVGYFYFKEDFPYLQSTENALACMALQIAETNARYAEQVAVKLKDAGEAATEVATWQRFFISMFGDSSKTSNTTNADHLYLIFDGLDEAREEQQKTFKRFLKDVLESKTNIRVLVTSRPEEVSLTALEPLVIDVTKERMLRDMRTLTWIRLNSLSRLRKFSLASKKIIRRKVTKQADSMLYIEHMLRRLSYIGREGAVLKELDHMPNSLPDLYKLMLDECRRNRSKEQYEALKRLFAWLAFSKQALSLAQAAELVKLTVTADDFDIEDELVGRSARLLELTRTRRPPEDQDMKVDEDIDDQSDDDLPPVDEYRNASLTFQERSLRQYFRAVSVEGHEDLRMPATSAHLTIMHMCIDLLVDSAPTIGDSGVVPNDLRAYASKYWYDHFNELDIESASTNDVCKVLSSVYRVMSNENNIAGLFERYAFAPDMYPDKDEAATTPWYERLKVWIEKGFSIMSDVSDSELIGAVKHWIAAVSANPDSLFLTLAEGHKRNWKVHTKSWAIYEAYTFAKLTFALTGKSFESDDGATGEVLAFAEVKDATASDAQSLRSIGATMFCLGCHLAYVEDEKEKAKTLFQNAIFYLERSIDEFKMHADQNTTLGYAQGMLAMTHAQLENYQAAVSVSREAMETLQAPGSSAETSDVSTFKHYIYRNQADWSTNLGDRDAAMEAYNHARECASYGLSGDELDSMICVLDNEEYDPDGQRLMDTLRSWTVKERHAWFEYLLDTWIVESSLSSMYRAAKLTGATTTVLEWLDAYEKTLDPGSLMFFNVKSTTADFHNKVLGESDKAREILRNILEHPPKAVGMGTHEDVLSERISAVRMELAGIIFAQFRNSSDPAGKDALLAELKSLPGIQTEDEFKESHIGMLIANMQRIMGPAREYQASMEKIFKTCIDGLEDNIQGNDSNSLRLLAKVLASLEGLERDARITLSAQFSVIDRTVFERSKETLSETQETDSSLGETEPEGPGGTLSKGSSGEEATTHQDSGGPDKDDGARPNGEVGSAAASGNEESTVPADVNIARITETSSDVRATAGNQPESAGADPAVDTNDSKTETEAATTKLTPPSDEDRGDYGIFCDGCGVEIEAWTEHFYLCLICPNCDFCESCHSKRLSWNRGETENFWKSYCGKNHHYIKGPMKDWRGIKDGVIRIADEEISVKEWIKGLKEERWPKAWERYWLRQEGLKDIDVTDCV